MAVFSKHLHEMIFNVTISQKFNFHALYRLPGNRKFKFTQKVIPKGYFFYYITHYYNVLVQKATNLKMVKLMKKRRKIDRFWKQSEEINKA